MNHIFAIARTSGGKTIDGGSRCATLLLNLYEVGFLAAVAYLCEAAAGETRYCVSSFCITIMPGRLIA
jgi:hypothetical protein